MPPAALTSLVANSKPIFTCCPIGVYVPDRGVTTPILIGPSAAIAMDEPKRTELIAKTIFFICILISFN